MVGLLIVFGGLSVILYILYLIARPKPPQATLEELFGGNAVPPCGEQNKLKHYEWEELIGMPCPVCASLKAKKQKSQELDELAEKIVKHLDRRNLTVPKD